MSSNIEACATDDDGDDDDGDDDDDDGDDGDDDFCGDCSGAKSEVGNECADQTAGICSECASDYYTYFECYYQAMWDGFCPNNACDVSGACADAVSAGTRNGVVFALALTLLAPFALRF